MFALIKSKLLLIGGGIMVAMVAIIKFLSMRNKSLKKERDSAQSELQFKEDVDNIESQLDQEFSHRAEVANEQKDKGEVPDVISTRNTNKF